MEKGMPGLLALLVSKKVDGEEEKVNNEEYKTGLRDAAQDLIDALKMDNAEAVAMALKDAFECVQDGDYEDTGSMETVKEADESYEDY